MKKLSSKIILISLLSIFLFSGLNFDSFYSQQDKNKFSIFDIKKATALRGSEMMDWLNTNYPGSDLLNPTPEAVSAYEDYKASGGGTYDVITQAPMTQARKDSLAGKSNPSWQTRLVESLKNVAVGGIGKTLMMIQGFILQILILPILTVFLRIAAAMLDAATKFTLNTTTFSNVNDGIVLIWSMIRNICNITFIFILLWSAIQMIIGVAGANTKKIVANVIIAALLINFSLFITRIVIDAGNIMAVAIYDKIMATPLPEGGLASGLDEIIIQALGLTGLSGMTSVTGSVFSIAFGVVSYLQVITIFVAFLVFMYAMLLMATRIVVLIFLAAMSPIGFMGAVLPKFAEYSKMWRETLYGQVMVAPVFLLFVYLIIQVGNTFNSLPGSINKTAEVGGALPGTGVETSMVDGGTADYMAYFKYVMIILLLIIAVKTTKKMMGAIGAAVEKFGMAAVGLAMGAATGGAALLARQTIGRGATNKLNDEYGKDLRAKADTGDRMAQAKLKSLEMASKSTYDVRNTKSFGKATGFVGDKVGLKIDAGKGGGSYSKDGKMTGFAGAQQAEQEKANKAFNDANKGVSAADRVAARDALERRRVAVESNLQGNTVHKTAADEVNRMKNEGIAGNQGIIDAERDIAHAQQKIQTGTATEKQEARKELAAANKARAEKEKELITKNEEKYKDDIAEQNKIIKEETRKAQLAVEGNMKKSTNQQDQDDLKKINRVERARNLAQAMRDGKVGIAGIIRSNFNPDRNEEIATRMEGQKEKSEAELLREEMQEMRREARDAAKNKAP